MMNILFSVCSTNELVLFIALAPKVNGKVVKPYYSSLAASYLTIMLLIGFTVAFSEIQLRFLRIRFFRYHSFQNSVREKDWRLCSQRCGFLRHF